jgi:pimeloyl-ACP methyl ester carboxylesterase
MRATVNGLDVTFTDEGGGVPLLLVHGFPLSRLAWGRQVEAFRGECRVLAPDLRGLGRSEATQGPVAMGSYARDLHALLEALQVGPVVLAGHSMGGYVALAFARAYPEALRGLVLVGTKAGADTAEAAAGRRALAERVLAEGVEVVLDAMAPKMLSAANTDAGMAAAVRSFMAESKPAGVMGALLGMAGREDALPWLGSLRVPTLVLAGAEDSIMPPSESERLAKAIPGAQLALVPGAGHLLPFEQPEAFNGLLRAFLASLPSGGPP